MHKHTASNIRIDDLRIVFQFQADTIALFENLKCERELRSAVMNMDLLNIESVEPCVN